VSGSLFLFFVTSNGIDLLLVICDTRLCGNNPTEDTSSFGLVRESLWVEICWLVWGEEVERCCGGAVAAPRQRGMLIKGKVALAAPAADVLAIP
jgi:hypothetical protein